ncbi:hypothetical protein GGX14DRAFT_456956 [Mycena pura]|uniref:DUF5648 domain-containing protein n=1 Tax=Mycena pura TaxID=153505 RepID=A0AAD6YB71_9AGAR|nr:hypothetical protein GGX14DRAFT_456956 [Mycena pura]
MKHILIAILLSAIASASTVRESPAAAVRTSETCGDPANAVPYYRSYNPAVVDHFYTTDVALVSQAIAVAAYTLQEVAAMVFVTNEESTVQLFRLFSPGATDNFYTTSTTEVNSALQNGYALVTFEPTTFIYPTQICGSVPFYRLFSATGLDNFYTTSESERISFLSQGYTDVEITGYVLPLEPTQCD